MSLSLQHLTVAPLVLPVLAAGLGLVAWQRPRAQAAVSLVTAALLLASTVVLLVAVRDQGPTLARMGGWAAPVGIPVGVDLLSGLLLVLTAIMALVATADAVASRHRSPAHLPLLWVVILGVSGAFLTRDLFNLYVWFEVLLMGSFGLLVVTGGRDGAEAAVKALALNLVGSLLFLLGVGITYGLAGTLDMTDLHTRLATVHAERPAAVTAVAALLAVAFVMKAAMFPFHFWLPASYHVPTAGVCALFAALLTKVGVYSLLRLFTLPFAAVDQFASVLGVLAGITMLGGVLGAVAQYDMKRILAWHSISQVGYMVLGVSLLGAGTAEARTAGVAAAVFFLLHHGLVKPALFLLAGLIERLQGTTGLRACGGLLQERPWLAVVFLLAALSLAGLPPLSGFWAKLAVVQAGVDAGAGWLVAAALVAGLLTLLSMLKIWVEAFWKPRPAEAATAAPAPRAIGAVRWSVVVGVVLIATAIGLSPQLLLELSRDAASSVLAGPGVMP